MNHKHQQALRIVRRYALFSAGAGLIPIHYLDLAAISAVQLKMLAEISKIYSVPFQENLGKEVIGSLGGFILPHAAAAGTIGSMLKAFPGFGGVAAAPLTAAFAAAYAWAMGNIFIQHFESGGTFLTFDPEKVRDYFKSQFVAAGKAPPVAEAV